MDTVMCEDAEAYLASLDLDAISLPELYEGACRRWNRRVNKHVAAALPAGLGGYEAALELDFGDAYTGSAGFAPLLPLVIACERAERLCLRGNGLRPTDTETLLEAVVRHPSLTALDLSRNDLGTSVGKALLRTVQLNPLLCAVGTDDCLVIPALRNKIRACAEANAAGRAAVPPRALRYAPTRPAGGQVSGEVLRKELAQRAEREESRKTLQRALPFWVPAALQELSETLDVHKAHVGDVLAMFGGDDCDSTAFARVMKTIGCRWAGPSSSADGGREGGGGQHKKEDRPFELASLLRCLLPAPPDSSNPPTHNAEGLYRIDCRQVVSLLRTPVRLNCAGRESGGEKEGVEKEEEAAGGEAEGEGEKKKPPPQKNSFDAAQQCVLTYFYDQREVLLDALRMLDTRGTGRVTLDEFLAGTGQLPYPNPSGGAGLLPAGEREQAVLGVLAAACEAVPSGGRPRSSSDAAATEADEEAAAAWAAAELDYEQLFSQIQPCEAPRLQWASLSSADVQTLAQRVGVGGGVAP